VSNFEERLLLELRRMVPAEQAKNRRRPVRRIALASGVAALAVVAATAGVLFLSAGTQSAYAVTKQADGSVTVQIDSISDAAGLQSALQAAGVNAVVEYLPAGKTCQQPWFTPAGPGANGGEQQSSVRSGGGGPTTFTISGDLPADETLVVTTQTGPGNERAIGIGWAKGDVPPCQVVDAPAGSGPLGVAPPGADTQTSQG
jgi:hypothetical protein